jgi:hypothetical protein
MNPINRGINCYIEDINFLFICYFLNEKKQLIKFKVERQHQNNDTLDFFYEILDIPNYINYVNNNTIIMPSVLKNRLKFFSCLYNQEDFDIIIQRPDGYFSSVKEYAFNCNKNKKIILFSVLKKGYGSYNLKNNILSMLSRHKFGTLLILVRSASNLISSGFLKECNSVSFKFIFSKLYKLA